ncbi:hypothetical protein [Endozoicomonas acroporae]|uniref:hypothetical protein n=1 Tax=Endozoicomonas acroporae TaxID=1701104 RepID=UPI003D7ADA09
MPKLRKFQRLDLHTSEESKNGRLFHHEGRFVDLSNIRILGTYVDTVRQLYKGKVNDDLLITVNDALSDNQGHLRLFDTDWIVGKCSRQSGYQYRLQNNDLGVIILFKSYHSKGDLTATHCKIELSPWFIETRSPQDLQDTIDGYAGSLLNEMEPNQCAIHLAVDLQGWTPGKDFVSNLRCRSRRVRELDGIESATFDLHEISATYGRGQSFLFGSAGGLQLGIYNKTLQAKATDKLDYMEQKWRQSSGSDLDPDQGYNPELDVFRFEFRFHHSVIEQFCNGSVDSATGELPLKGASTYVELINDLQGFWNYGVDSFKLMYNSRTLDPFWSILQEEPRFHAPDPILTIVHKRHYKTANGFTGKNVDLFMGNYISLCARQRKPAREVWKELKSLSTFETIQNHYESKGIYTQELKSKIKKALKDRKLRGYGV